METLTSKCYWREIKRIALHSDDDEMYYSFLLLHEDCYRYRILALSKHPEAILESGIDLVQYQILDGYEGLLKAAVYKAVYADIEWIKRELRKKSRKPFYINAEGKTRAEFDNRWDAENALGDYPKHAYISRHFYS